MNKSNIRNKKGQFIQRESNKKYDGFSVYECSKGYEIIYIAGREIKAHVYLWEKENGEKPKGYEIHHKNHIKNDNDLDNLQLLTYSDHKKIHAGWVMEKGEWSKKPCTSCGEILPLSCFYERKGYTPTANCKICHNKLTATWQNKNLEKVKKYKKEWYERRK